MDNNQRRRLQSKIDRAYGNAYRLNSGRRAKYWYRQAVRLERKLHGDCVLHFVDLSFDKHEANETTMKDMKQLLHLANLAFGAPQKFMSIQLELDPEKQKYDVVLSEKV